MLVTTLFLSLLACHVNSQFIVDSKSPIVILDGSGGGDRRLNNSFFGYSLAFIQGVFGDGGSQTFGGQPTSSVHGTLFIGAPTEKQYTRNSGVIWGCQFSENVRIECSLHSKVSDAAPITKSACRNQKPTEYPEPEKEQWIGASLTASNDRGHLFACAPRMKLNGYELRNSYSGARICKDETPMFGGCYKTTSVNSDPTLLFPLNEPENFYYRSMDNTGQSIDEYWYMYGEYGFSSHTTRFDSLVVGAPSARKWTGMYLEHRKEDPRSPHVRNHPIIHNPNGNIPGVEAHSLLGYAITSGRIQGRDEYVAVGAPRAQNLYGAVLITSSHTSLRELIIGNQLGSYFGYSLATADLDGNGDDELIVGAPMQTSDYNSKEGYSSGCVYIYDIDAALQFRLLSRLYVPKTSNTRLEARGARFGSAVVNLGDINDDKKDDFAISAPYHDGGVGTVFVYYGGASSQLLNPVQTIKGKSLEIPSLYGFGTYLLAGKLDADGNTTPDLAVASFESNHAIIFRTRPVAQATVRVTYHMVDTQENIVKFLPTQSQLLVKVCVKFQFSINLSRENVLDTWIKFEADPKEKRFDFDDGKGAEYTQPLSSIEERCLPRHLKLKEGVRVESNLNPILFRVVLWYNATQPFASQTVKPITIVLPQHQPQRQATNDFNPFLPSPISDTIAESVLVIASDDCESDGNPGCDPDLKLKLDMHYEDEKKQKSLYTNQPLMVGRLEELILTITLSNKGETAYRPTLSITLKFSEDFEIPPIAETDWRWLVKDSSGKVDQFQRKPNAISNNSIITDILWRSQSQPLQRGQSNIYELRVGNLKQMKVKDSLNGKLAVIVEAYPEFQKQEEKVKVGPVEIPLEAKFYIDIQTLPNAKMADIDRRNNHVDLTQLYILRNTGFSSSAMDRVKIEIIVPTHAYINNNLTQVFGVVNPAHSQTKMQCKPEDFEFYNPIIENSRKDASMEPTSSRDAPQSLTNGRSTRSTKTKQGNGATVEAARLTISSSDNLISLVGCDSPSLYCRKITCFTDMPSMGQKAIRLHMYLTNAARKLISEETTGISIESSVFVSYLKTTGKKNWVIMRMFLLDKGIAAWKLLVAGAGGTILFLLLTFALFKCGFFRRKTKEQLRTLKRQTQVLLPADGSDPSMPEDEDAQHENTHF